MKKTDVVPRIEKVETPRVGNEIVKKKKRCSRKKKIEGVACKMI